MKVIFRQRESAVQLDQESDNFEEVSRWLYTFCMAPYTIWVDGMPSTNYDALYDQTTHTFPVGLLRNISRALADGGHSVEVIDERVKPGPVVPRTPDGITLWEHQKRCVEAALEAEVGIIKAATGAGKSFIAGAIIAATPDTEWLVLVHRDTIRHQLHESFEKWVPGEVSGLDMPRKRVVVATFQSVNRHLRELAPFLRSVTGIIVDECHVAGARTYLETVKHCTSAYYRIGMSATPFQRSDKRDGIMMAQLGGLVADITTKELVDKGVLAKAKVTFVQYQHTNQWYATYAAAYKAGVTANISRATLVADIVDRAAKPSIVFFKHLKHGRVLDHLIQQRGWATIFVDGKTPKEARHRVRSELKKGKADVVVASVVFNEGLDIPELESVVNASAGKSTIQTLQRIGRGLRKSDGKDSVEVYDIFDANMRWLLDHSQRRVKVLRDAGHDVQIVRSVEEV